LSMELTTVRAVSALPPSTLQVKSIFLELAFSIEQD